MKIDFDEAAVEQVIIAGLQKEHKRIKELLKIHAQTDEFDNGDSFLVAEMHDEDIKFYRKLKAAIKMVLEFYGD